MDRYGLILRDPGATCRGDAIFSARKFTNPRELFLTKRVPEVVEIGPADWPERSFYGQSAGRISTTSGTRLVRTSSQGSSALEVNFRAENIASPRQVAPGSPRMIWPKP